MCVSPRDAPGARDSSGAGAFLQCCGRSARHPLWRDDGERPTAHRLEGMTKPITGLPRRRAHPGVALLLLAAVLTVGTLAIAWAPAIGDGRSQVCLDRGVPYAPPYESWGVQAAESWLPLGVTCTWTDPTTGNVIRQEPAWTPTVLAGVSFVSGLAWFAAVGWRSRRHQAMN